MSMVVHIVVFSRAVLEKMKNPFTGFFHLEREIVFNWILAR